MQITVSKARSSQQWLLDRASAVSVSEGLCNSLGIVPTAQLRMTAVENGSSGAYSALAVHSDDGIALRMSAMGRDSLGIEAGDAVRIESTVPRTDCSYQEAWRTGECVETVWHEPDDDPDIVFLAPHGGDAERNTDRSAVFASKRYGLCKCSTWLVHNFGPEAFSRWHITSTELAPVSYPGLQRLHGYGFEFAVSFHLWNGSEVIVGGGADEEIRAALASAIADAIGDSWDVVYEDAKYMGDSPANIVNRLTADGARGIQIEAPPSVCQRYRKRLGETVAEFLADWQST